MMTRWSCAVAVLCLTACGGASNSKPAAQPGSCGGDVCAEAQRCDASTLRCVTNEAPLLTLVAPTTVISDAQFEISGRATDDTEVTTLEWREGVDAWKPLVPSADGAFAFTVPTHDLDAEPVAITVRASDGQEKVERFAIVIVDRVGPALELKAPSTGTVSGGSSVTVTVIAHDGSDGLRELSIGGQSIASPRTGIDLSAEVVIPAGERRGLEVVVAAKDLDGNRTTQTFTLQVDGAGPALRFIAPTGQPAPLNTPSFRAVVEALDPSAVQRVRLAMADGGLVDATAQDGGLWVAEFPIPEVEQQVTFTAEAVDAVGNLSSLRSAPVQIDRVAPSVEVTGPDPDSIVGHAFSVAVLAGPDATTVTASFAGTTIPLQFFQNDGKWEGQMPLTVMRDYSPELVVAVARDAAGNQRSSAPYRLFIDTVAPTLTFTSPAANAKLNRSSFVGTDDVTVSWQVQDADPQAATVSVGGVPTTANDVRVSTSPSDDGRTLTTTVVAADRRGNVVMGSLTFSVDRVAPSIVSWLPAANARNVEPRTTSVTFSERVTGPTTSTDALAIAPGVTQPGTWSAAHTTWTSVDLAPYSVFAATLANLTDDSGNPVAPSSRQFHTAAFVPASGTVLAANVQSFKLASDADGVLTLAIATATSFNVQGLSPVTGTLSAPSVHVASNLTDFELNAWAVIDPATLVATHRVGASHRSAAELHRHAITDGTAVPISFIATGGVPGSVLSVPAFSGEADASAFAVTNSTNYLRGTSTVGVSSSPNLIAQAGYTWAGFSTSSSAVTWSRFLCVSGFFGSPNCTSYVFNSPATTPTELRAAVSPSSQCLVASWNSGSQRVALFQPLAYCNEKRWAGTLPHPSCQNTSGPTPVALTNSLRVAPFSGNGELTMLAAYSDGGLRLGKMTNPAACTNSFTPVGNPLSEAATSFEPVQLGNKPALLYIDASSNLKLFVP